MRNALVFIGALVFTVIGIASVIVPRESWRIASAFLPRSVRASTETNSEKQSLPVDPRDYSKTYVQTAANDAQSQNNSAATEPPTKSLCSNASVTETVKSLTGGKFSSPFKIAGDVTLTIDAIRTVLSLPNRNICEARLTTSYDVMVPTHLPQDGPVAPGTPTEIKNHVDNPEEISYKIEKTDDGQFYITIIPSASDIQNQLNAQQRERDFQIEEQQQENRQFEEDDLRNDEIQQRYQGR